MLALMKGKKKKKAGMKGLCRQNQLELVFHRMWKVSENEQLKQSQDFQSGD